MALADRDWYRESFRKGGGGDGGPGPTDTGGGSRLRYRPLPTTDERADNPSRVNGWGRAHYLAIAVALVITVGGRHSAEIDATASDWVVRLDAAVTDRNRDQSVAPSHADKIIRLGNRPGLDVPAATVAEWWVDHPILGRVSVHVPIGTTPRKALTIAFAERGYQAIR